MNGLAQVVVGPGAQAQDFIHVLGAGAEHEDGEVPVVPDSPADLEPVQTGEHEVQDDEMDVAAVQETERLLVRSSALRTS